MDCTHVHCWKGNLPVMVHTARNLVESPLKFKARLFNCNLVNGRLWFFFP